MPDDASSTDDASTRYVKTTFLGRVAHDIRGPSGVTLGAIDELEAALGAELAKEHEKLFSMMRRSSRKVLRIAEKLGRAGEMVAGLSLDPCKVILSTSVQTAIKDAEAAEGRRGIRVELVPVDPRAAVTIDAAWLESMLCEVVSNALRSAKTMVRVEVNTEGQDVCITVEDDGRGQAKPIKPLFSPADERRGLGLSLSMTDRLLSMFGGRLETADRSEGGMRVVLRLPTTPA